MGEAEVFKDSARVSNRADRVSGHLPSGAFGVCPEERCRLPEVLQLEPGQGADVSVPKRLGESLSVQVCCFMRLFLLYLQRGKGDLDSKVLPCASEKGKGHLSVIRGLQDAEVRALPALHLKREFLLDSITLSKPSSSRGEPQLQPLAHPPHHHPPPTLQPSLPWRWDGRSLGALQSQEPKEKTKKNGRKQVYSLVPLSGCGNGASSGLR